MTLYMGYTKTIERCHFVDVITGYETKALCGAKIAQLVCNIKTGEPVQFRDHWADRVTNCLHCERIRYKKERLNNAY